MSSFEFHEPLLRILAQHGLPDLARLGHREGVDEDDVARQLEARDLAAAEGDQLRLAALTWRETAPEGFGWGLFRGEALATNLNDLAHIVVAHGRRNDCSVETGQHTLGARRAHVDANNEWH